MKKMTNESLGAVYTGSLKENKKKNIKGITLVALVITIIILLILAGISIASLTGNGLFKKAKLAKEKSEEAQELEDSILKDYEEKIQGIRNSKLEESKIISDFNIVTKNISTNKITINLSEYTSTENVIGYIVFIGDDAIDITKTMPYNISDLQKDTEYKDIYVIAIDNKGKMKQSSNKLSERTKAMLVEGLVAYWPLQSNLLNEITENNFIEVDGTAAFETDSVYLEKNSLRSSNTFYMEGNQTTFIQYKRVKEPTGWGMMFGYDDPCTSVGDHRSLYWDTYENSVCLIVNNGYGQHISFGLDEALPLNTWVNIAVTTDETNTTLYINGKQKSNSFLYKYDIQNRKICLGANSGNKGFPGGYYKNFGIINRALSENELNNLFDSL